jgi:AcrR family transcriptional regulator
MPAHQRPTDRRVDRSRRKLHDALVALILERGWDRVSVRAVCDRAGVGRSTFYVHFADKEDLLIGGLDNVRDDLRAMKSKRPFGFMRGLFEHAGQSRRLFHAVIGKHSGLAVQRRLREVVLELTLEDLSVREMPERRLQMTSRFLSGALVELLIWWVDGSCAMSARDVEAMFLQLATTVLEAARDGR